MRGASRAVRARFDRFAAARPGQAAQLRLFGLLLMLGALFAGLQLLVRESDPRVEVQFVPHDVPVLVPVERIVERVVERTVVVPVPVTGTPDPVLLTPVPTPQSNSIAPGAAVADGSNDGAPARGLPGEAAPPVPAQRGTLPGPPVAVPPGGSAPIGLPGPAGLPGPSDLLPGAPRATPVRDVVVATEDRLGRPATEPGQQAPPTPGREIDPDDESTDVAAAGDERHETEAQPVSNPPARAMGASRPLLVPAPIGVKPPPDAHP